MPNRPHILIAIGPETESGRDFITGVANHARLFGPWRVRWEPRGVQSLKRPLKDYDFDGAVVWDSDAGDVEVVQTAGIPAVVLLNKRRVIPDVIGVNTEDAVIGKLAAEHFLHRGFKNFAFLGRVEAVWSDDRQVAFCDAVQEAGHDVETYKATLIKQELGDGRFDSDPIEEWLRELPKPVALLAVNDGFARYAVELCNKIGIRVPEECSVVGVGNDLIRCDLADPPISSIEVQFQAAGREATSLLARLMQGEKLDSPLVTAKAGDLVVRQSSEMIAVEDANLSRALRFVMANAHRLVTVDEIAKASGLSRRALETRFRKTMGTSAQRSHREARADYVAKMLGETQLSLEEIAEQCGFAQGPDLTRLFKSIKGETPSAYRKRVYG
jgi:LacI family transcriptional regulator